MQRRKRPGIVQFGIERLGRHEHDGRRLSLAGDDVFLRDVLHVAADIGAHAALRLAFFDIARGVFQHGRTLRAGIWNPITMQVCAPGSRIRQSWAGSCWKASPEIHTSPPAARRGLWISIWPLAPGAARLLVGEDLLQAHHLPREIGEILLRFVDDDKAQCGLARPAFRRSWRRSPQIIAEPLVERFQTLGHGAAQIALAFGLALDGLGKSGPRWRSARRQARAAWIPREATRSSSLTWRCCSDWRNAVPTRNSA